MADDPDNLVLRLLREIRSKLDQHDQRFEAIDRRFEAIDQRFEGIDQRFATIAEHLDERFDEQRDLMTHLLGVSSASDLQLRDHKVRFKDNDRWRQRVDVSLESLERRVGKLEGEPQG